MLCTCPACGFHAPLLSFTAEQAAMDFARLMGRVPPQIAHLVEQYLQMFATPKHRPTFAKAVRVLVPLVEMIEGGSIRRSKRDWPLTLVQFSEGLAAVVAKRTELVLPLRSHGYLLAVLAGAANQVEAKAEANAIEQQRQPTAPAATPTDTTAARQVRAISALTAELAACRRTRITPERDALTRQLTQQGYSADEIAFAFSKVPFKPE